MYCKMPHCQVDCVFIYFFCTGLVLKVLLPLHMWLYEIKGVTFMNQPLLFYVWENTAQMS